MTINVKYLIGLLLLMGIGAFLCSWLGTDPTWTNLTTSAENFGASFSAEAYKGAWDVILQSIGFLWSLLGFFGNCIFWNFSFFEGFEVIQVLLIFINMAILTQIMVDIYRMLKPFGG
jgi:hypothetical protein